jgi:hypothetical protein
MRQIVKDAINIPEFSHVLHNVIGVDDNKTPEEYSDRELISEARYILSCFGERGHLLNDLLNGDDGPEEQKYASQNVKMLRAFIAKHTKGG